MLHTTRALIVAVVACDAVACGLFPDLSGLEGTDGAANDGSSIDASSIDASSIDGGLDACPSGRGPTMVSVGAKQCIDSTEVTVAQYRAFYTSVDAGNFTQVAACGWNHTFNPNGGVPGTGSDLKPISGVNWCQANAFCAWAGKTQCGAPAGGPLPFTSYTDPAQSLWMKACSANGTQSYPYGNVFQSGACNNPLTPDASVAVAPVMSFPKCVGSAPGLFDMIGNLTEWEDSCTSTGDAPADNCRRRGSGFDEPPNASTGTCSYDEADRRDHQSATTGMRCCAILP